jgi:tetratricopeptide (TPR) repeat protein
VETRLKAARQSRGMKKMLAMHLFAAAVARRDRHAPGEASLKRMFAYWENGGRPVENPDYQAAFCEIYGVTRAELGFDEPRPTVVLPELHQRLSFTAVDRGLVDLLEGQTQHYRLLDRRLGAARLLPQTEAHVQEMENQLRYALPGPHRAGIAQALAEAAALAGWQALDLGDLDRAWRLHETAKASARESEDPAVLAHVTAQQANVLLDAGRYDDAVTLVDHAHQKDAARLPALLRAWLLAAEGEARAAAGDGLGARRALDEAQRVLPAEPTGPELPFLMLDESHLARWRGHCLARLGAAEAVEDLTSALDAAGETVRAETGLRVDLALALTARGDTTEAHKHAARAAELAGESGSARQRARIGKLLAS